MTMYKKIESRRVRVLAFFGAVALASGCGGVVTNDGDRDEGASDIRTAGEREARHGEVRTGTFVTARGRARLRYELIGGQRVHQGDIILPPSEEERASLDRSTLSAGRATDSFRWPDNTVPYHFDSAVPAATRAAVIAAMDHWEQNTSIRFRARDGESDWLEIVVPAPDVNTCSSMVGRQGGMQVLNAVGSCTIGNFIHELGHAVGLFHEQERADRGAFVTIDFDCIDPSKANNFDQYTSGADYGLYDFTSVMHYGSTGFLASPVPASCDNGGTSNTMWRRSSAPGTFDTLPGQRTGLSFIDRQGVEEMYSEAMGHAVVVADFNGDGFRDVAVGAPRRGSVRAGRVLVYRGSAAGLTLDASLDQGLNAQDEDRFGFALTTGDFNNDGRQDLAVGIPGEDDSAGRVVVYTGRGSGNVLGRWMDLDQRDLGANEPRDRFGYALIAGDFDGDGDADLAVGAPGEGWSGAASSGAVFLFKGGASLTAWVKLGQSTLGDNEPGDSFGASLAQSDFDNDGDKDLVVGAPHERVGSDPEGGMVFLYRGGASVTAWRTLRPTVGATNYNDWDLFFGFSLTTGDFNNDGLRDLAVGAPGATVNNLRWAGRVLVYLGTASGPSAGSFTLTEDTPSLGAAFGYSLASNRFNTDSYSDLAVGAPGSDPSTNVASGQVTILHGRSASPQLTRVSVLSQSGTASGNEAGDRFGCDVGVGDVDNDGDADLVIGAEGERWGTATQEGRAFSFRANGSTLASWETLAP